MDFDNFGVEEESQVIEEYEVGDDVYEVERTVKQARGDEFHTDRIKLDGDILEVQRDVNTELEEETHAYGQLLSYLKDSKLENMDEDSWGNREVELEENYPLGRA